VSGTSLTTVRNWLIRDGIDLAGNGVSCGFTSEAYALPTLDWVRDVFAPYWTDIRGRFSIRYSNTEQDCNHFSQGAAWWAGICHANTDGRPKRTGLLFGEMFYRRRDGEYHAINFGYTDKDGDGLLFTFDPQSSKLITLTTGELNSCGFIRV
jgi:hypothetical protein